MTLPGARNASPSPGHGPGRSGALEAAALARQGFRLALAFRQMSRNPVDAQSARRTIQADMARREERFLEVVDRLVWPFPRSPTRRLLGVFGIEPGDLRSLVHEDGLDGGLARLRDLGVYVSYAESRGECSARRGSASLDFDPGDFTNPACPPDVLVSTSGTRSAGVVSGQSFEHIRRLAVGHAIRHELWGVRGAPTAIWRPAFPGGGLSGVLSHLCAGNPPQAWFSQIELNLRGTAGKKRVANRALVAASILTRGELPRPTYAPVGDPRLPLAWLREALARAGRATCTGYASSWTHLATVAAERGISLEGTVMKMSGEPVTEGKVAAVEATGARVANSYGAVPDGILAISCPHAQAAEELHLMEHDHAVIGREIVGPDGMATQAVCVTSLSPWAPRVILNVENDDIADWQYDRPCDCLLGEMGMTTRLLHPRGVSKLATGGTTLPVAALQRLAEQNLPARFGGGPTDYQFVEEERMGITGLTLRVDPRLGPMAAEEIVTSVRQGLAATEPGAMSAAIWSDSLKVVRMPVIAGRSGKVLSFERLSSSLSSPATVPA